ncbi:MAG: hypothetical protein KAT05_03420 [Spirochaetes bacterium]|nr:hypothetical protein [Spirochaetota bacterium]
MLETKERVPMICPVGLEFDRVIAGIQKFPVNFIHIVHSYTIDGKKAVDKEAQSFAKKINDSPYFKSQTHPTNVLDLSDCIKTLKKIMEIEKETENIYINVGTSSKIFTIASIYIASLEPNRIHLFYPKAGSYIVMEIVDLIKKALKGDLNEYKDQLSNLVHEYENHGWTTSDREDKYSFDIINVPVIPFKPLTKTQMKILNSLYISAKFDSIKELILSLDDNNVPPQSISRSIRQLQDLGLVKTSGKTREKQLSITSAGMIYIQTFLV